MTFARSALGFLIAVLLGTTMARAETALVAVASNFADAMAAITDAFEADSGHRIQVSLGSTGKLYAQIHAGAPYDAFLSADHHRPEKLAAEKLAIPGSRFTYALGQLTLWSADPVLIAGDPKTLLADTSVRAIAIANPALAPYGLAARQTLETMGLWHQLKSRIVTGENIGQAFALTATANAELGFVARPQLESKRGKSLGGSRWDVPADMHAPIRQDAVLLRRASANRAAIAFMAFLRSAKARAIMTRLGYKSATE